MDTTLPAAFGHLSRFGDGTTAMNNHMGAGGGELGGNRGPDSTRGPRDHGPQTSEFGKTWLLSRHLGPPETIERREIRLTKGERAAAKVELSYPASLQIIHVSRRLKSEAIRTFSRRIGEISVDRQLV